MEAGFEGGALKGTLFADVPEAFAHWASQGKVAIYSSGSVEAQQLLFRHSTYGDLTPLISSYFDTRPELSLDSASYAAIARVNVDSRRSDFFSDVVREFGCCAGGRLFDAARGSRGERAGRGCAGTRGGLSADLTRSLRG